MVRDKFKINFAIQQYVVQADPEDRMIGGYTYHFKREPELKMTITVTEDHTSWTEMTDLEFVIFGSDIKDGSKVDEVIGGNIKGYDLSMRQALRLAFIIYNGIVYGTKHEVRQKDIDAGWHPRVVSSKMRF